MIHHLRRPVCVDDLAVTKPALESLGLRLIGFILDRELAVLGIAFLVYK